MDSPWQVKIVIVILSLALFWIMLDMMVWGLLIFLAALSILGAMASWIDGSNPNRKGTRIFIWFLNQPLLIEGLGVLLGLLAGGTGTLTGLNYAITTGIIATLFRWLNTMWEEWQGMTLIGHIHSASMPKDWDCKETFWHIVGIKRRRSKEQ